MRSLTLLLLVCALVPAALVASGCGSDTKVVTGTNSSGQATTRTVPDVKFAKTKFVLHTGLAIGAFRRWIYKPWKAGTFKKGADGRTKALVKAAAAGAQLAALPEYFCLMGLRDDAKLAVAEPLGQGPIQQMLSTA